MTMHGGRIRPWDYLIVTASNDDQAAAYQTQLQARREFGFLSQVRQALVVADPGGRRVGSGGSTLHCLLTVLEREAAPTADPLEWERILGGLRVLIVHAGGDSRRLPPYGACGKAFIPVPSAAESILGVTLFDRQAPIYMSLPPAPAGRGQVVITSGDVVLDFNAAQVDFGGEGITGLGAYARPEEASRHGVYCANRDGSVREFLQKPPRVQQQRRGAIDRYGRAILDIGAMSFDARAAATLLALADVAPAADRRLRWTGAVGEAIETKGLDFYVEVCCALGSDVDERRYVTNARAGGSAWDEDLLRRVHRALSGVPFRVQVLPQCAFLHFGTLRQLIESGLDLARQDRRFTGLQSSLCLNTLIEEGRVTGGPAWIEGCRVRSELRLAGGNVVVGVDIDEPVSLPRDSSLDVLPGRNRAGAPAWFVRPYVTGDELKRSADDGGSIWGIPLAELPHVAQVEPTEIWDAGCRPAERSAWNARLFPAEPNASGYVRWLWLFDVAGASAEQWAAWRAADRYSSAQIAASADQGAFLDRRARLRATELFQSGTWMLRRDSDLSAAELARGLACLDDLADGVATVISEARRAYASEEDEPDLSALNHARIAHTLATALERLAASDRETLRSALGRLEAALSPQDRQWLDSVGLGVPRFPELAQWARRTRAAAFAYLGRAIMSSGHSLEDCPRNALRSDEIAWGRAPARLDLGGGWSDTPPYALEWGGCVINAAVDLNEQPPIQAYGRVIPTPIIRLATIDRGELIEIAELEDLLDYRHVTDSFSLPKAALAISGFAPESAPWPAGITLAEMLNAFGGGIELTTLAAVPSGSGLGTSSILGAVILAVICRILGRPLDQRELFHGVLRLEQALTTGGGWQDQVGGVVPGVKVVSTQPGLVPSPLIHFVPADVLDPAVNGGCTLLYYTGLTRLAKNILQNVVGRYLDRDRAAMTALRRIHSLPAEVADALARKDPVAFGEVLSVAWDLKKQLDPGSTNADIDSLLARVRPHVYGAKVMGAGGGGFLLLVCKSARDAAAVRADLEAAPPNPRARFFDFHVSTQGLAVTVC